MSEQYEIGTVAMLSGNDGEEDREFLGFKIRPDLWEHVVVVDDSGKAITAGWTDPPKVRPLVVIDPEDTGAIERLMTLYVGTPLTDDEVPDMQRALRKYANPTATDEEPDAEGTEEKAVEDSELVAIRAVSVAIKDLPLSVRRRILTWAQDRYATSPLSQIGRNL